MKGSRTSLARARLPPLRSQTILSTPLKYRLRCRPLSTIAVEESTQPDSHSPITISTSRTEPDQGLHSYTRSSDGLDPIRIIRLPDLHVYGSRESGKFADHQLPEQLAVMYACLNTGDMDRARRIFMALHKNNPDDMLILGDIRMHNSFMESYMNASPSPRSREALRWFETLSRYGVEPDLTSFAILIKGFIK